MVLAVFAAIGLWIFQPDGAALTPNGAAPMLPNKPVMRLDAEVPLDVMAFSSNGKLLATASHDKTVRLWKVDV